MPAFPMDRLLEYLSHHPWLATATAVVAALIAVYEMRARSESLVSVTPQELIRLMNQGALLLDLRAPEQYQVGHLAGARQMSGEEIEVEAVPGAHAEMLARSGCSTVPQIFIGDAHIGGADELEALEAAGRLDPMLK